MCRSLRYVRRYIYRIKFNYMLREEAVDGGGGGVSAGDTLFSFLLLPNCKAKEMRKKVHL